jgi:L-alanine-DL-glutamate epimerase-like enolase superfamily enzyme
MTAIELLTAWSGKSAEEYEPCFQYSDKRRITGVEIYAVGMDNTTARYSGRDELGFEVNNVLRITTADGLEGLSGVDSCSPGQHSNGHFIELQGVAADLPSLRTSDPVEIGRILEQARPDLSDAVRSSIDIAFWDLAARRASQPLCKMLGATRNQIEAYASLPFYDSFAEYVEAANAYAKLGYETFKLHVWGSIERDTMLVDLIRETFADTPHRFMIDLEGAYDFEDALRLGKRMEGGLFIWLEAPMDDALLDQYAELRSRLEVEVVPAGYNTYSSEFIRQGIDAGAWDAGRISATVVGGISKALELLSIANDAELAVELQSWGHSLSQAVNLHLMLANERTRYFEAPMPPHVFEFGMTNTVESDRGRVVAPRGPGLGIQPHWESLAVADFYACSKSDL